MRHSNLKKNPRKINYPPFSKDNQPTPEAKRMGWERRREAQRIMDIVLKMQDMTWKEMKELIEDVKLHPERHTVLEVKLANYVRKDKYIVDFLDRHIGRAPIEIGGMDGGAINIVIKTNSDV